MALDCLVGVGHPSHAIDLDMYLDKLVKLVSSVIYRKPHIVSSERSTSLAVAVATKDVRIPATSKSLDIHNANRCAGRSWTFVFPRSYDMTGTCSIGFQAMSSPVVVLSRATYLW